MAREKKKLDTVVKMGLGVFIGAFALIWGGMFLTRPDRSIPPYSIGYRKAMQWRFTCRSIRVTRSSKH